MAALLALATMAVYWPATRYNFVNLDDDLYVTGNAQSRGLTWASLKWALLKPCGHQLASLNRVGPTWWSVKCSV